MEITNTTYLVLGLLTCVNFLLAVSCLYIASAVKKRRDDAMGEDHNTRVLDNDYFENEAEQPIKKKKIAFVGKIQPGKRRIEKQKAVKKSKKKKQ